MKTIKNIFAMTIICGMLFAFNLSADDKPVKKEVKKGCCSKTAKAKMGCDTKKKAKMDCDTKKKEKCSHDDSKTKDSKECKEHKKLEKKESKSK